MYHNMKVVTFSKYKKKIKIIKNSSGLEVIGPLGSIQYKIKFLKNSKNFDLFLEKSKLNFFYNNIRKLFRSVSNGWFLELNLNGIGYKAFKLDDKIAFDLGYSNLIIYKPTTLLKIKNLKNKLLLFSLDKEYLNNVAINIKNYSIPDKYKGKGILFKNEVLKLKKKK